MDKYKNKYRIGSHRKPHWDYSANALYFLTIVTQNRKCILGNVINAKIILSDMGKIVNDEFLKSFDIRNELFLCEYIIMPNHLHTIVEIRNPDNVKSDGRPIHIDENVQSHGNVEPHGRAVLQSESIKPNMPTRLPKSISSFIAGFKSAVNTKIDDYIDEHNLQIPKYNRNNHFFQPNYHDHIVRNSSEYQRIADYIQQNPSKWNNDTLNSE